MRLTRHMKEALIMTYNEPAEAFAHRGSTVDLDGGMVAVGYRTALALSRRGLARIDWTDCVPGEDCPTFELTDAGRALVKGWLGHD